MHFGGTGHTKTRWLWR